MPMPRPPPQQAPGLVGGAPVQNPLVAARQRMMRRFRPMGGMFGGGPMMLGAIGGMGQGPMLARPGGMLGAIGGRL